jgi:hypothetical protein
MSLVEHAKRELAAIGADPSDFPSGEVLELVETFSKQGHTGSSAAWTNAVLGRLLDYKPLGPLTNDPSEWQHIPEEMAGQPDVWQSRRRPDAFSNDGGKTYYCLDEEPYDEHGPIHVAEEAK